jgi:glycosyltransferase involved in cell wall biosynthesis
MKLAFITPRYGADITAGPEHACRLIAEHVSQRHDVDVLTTCARDAHNGANGHQEGQDRVRGVRVRRFPVTGADEPQAVAALKARLLREPHSREDELDWVRRAGPWSSSLFEHLGRQHRTYDAVVFFSLVHATTVHGLTLVPDRSVLFPYLQYQDVLRLHLWSDVLASPKALGFFSQAEQRLLRSWAPGVSLPQEVVGIGIDPPPRQSYPRHQQDPADNTVDEDETVDADAEAEVPADDAYLTAPGVPFRRRHRLYGPFALYGGRVEPDNGCEEMLEYFDAYARGDGGMPLVLMGAKMMKVRDESYLLQAGVLPERDRMVAFEAADLTIAPSSEDLLAQSLLESFAVGTPVLTSAGNPAAVEHCRRANAGLYYANREEFVEAMRLLAGNPALRRTLGDAGRTYVEQHHRWDAVVTRFERLITRAKPR